MATHRQYQTHDHQEYLRKVAYEGFADVDRFYGRGTTKISPPPPPLAPPTPPTPRLYDDREYHRYHYQYYPQQAAAVMNSKQVAQMFGGTLIPARRRDF